MTAPPVLAPRLGLHLGYLDSLRGLSALYVAACHAYLMYAADFAAAGLRSASGALLVGTSWVMFGRAAVAVFIVLSGYCLMLPIVQSPGQEWRVAFWPFMWRRAWRILPPYYGALACSAALILLVPALADPSIREWHKSFPAFGTGSVVSHLLLVHNYFPAYQYAIDHPLWSIATEWQIYFLFPLLLWIGKRQGDFSIVVTAGAITMALNLYLLNFSPQHNPWPPQFVGLFGFGMACAAWSFPGAASAPLDAQRWRRQAIVLLGAGAVASVVFAATRQQQLPDLLVGGGIGCAMVFLTNAVLTGFAAGCTACARASVARRPGALLVQSVSLARAGAGAVLSAGPPSEPDTAGLPALHPRHRPPNNGCRVLRVSPGVRTAVHQTSACDVVVARSPNR